MSVLDLVIDSAHAGRGRTLDPGQTREAAKDIITLSERFEFVQNMIVAYMNEFGPELFYELAGTEVFHEGTDEVPDSGEDIVEAEIDADSVGDRRSEGVDSKKQEHEETRPSAEGAGQDAQSEEEGEMDVSDEDQRDPSPDEEIIGGYGSAGESGPYVL